MIGSNKKDSQDTVNTLIEDICGAELADFAPTHTEDLQAWFRSRQPALVTNDHWRLIDAHERSAGEGQNRPRVKLTDVAHMLRVAHG